MTPIYTCGATTQALGLPPFGLRAIKGQVHRSPLYSSGCAQYLTLCTSALKHPFHLKKPPIVPTLEHGLLAGVMIVSWKMSHLSKERKRRARGWKPYVIYCIIVTSLYAGHKIRLSLTHVSSSLLPPLPWTPHPCPHALERCCVADYCGQVDRQHSTFSIGDPTPKPYHVDDPCW